MSLLSRETLRIALSPERAIVSFFSRGKLVSKNTHAAEGNAVELLSAILPESRGKDATLVLSSHFVKFMIIPWQEALSEQELQAMVAHRFSEIHGEGEREIRISEGKIGAPFVASAIDRGFLEGIRQAFSSSGVRLRSVQPYLMAAFNDSRKEMKEASSWFVLMEKGISCIARIREGTWERLRQCRGEIDEAWLMLEREAVLAEDAGRNVYLYAPEHPGIHPEGKWSVHFLGMEDKAGA